MDITDKDVRHIARLARLKLSDEEIKKYGDQLKRILEHMGELSKLDTKDIAPMAHVLGLSNVMRDDVVQPFFERERLLGNAPAFEGPYFKVPKVIE